jgi:hypothetical protein
MNTILLNILHSYVVIVLGLFVLFCLFAMSGAFDSWGKRYTHTRAGKKIPHRVR